MRVLSFPVVPRCGDCGGGTLSEAGVCGKCLRARWRAGSRWPMPDRVPEAIVAPRPVSASSRGKYRRRRTEAGTLEAV